MGCKDETLDCRLFCDGGDPEDPEKKEPEAEPEEEPEEEVEEEEKEEEEEEPGEDPEKQALKEEVENLKSRISIYEGDGITTEEEVERLKADAEKRAQAAEEKAQKAQEELNRRDVLAKYPEVLPEMIIGKTKKEMIAMAEKWKKQLEKRDEKREKEIRSKVEEEVGEPIKPAAEGGKKPRDIEKELEEAQKAGDTGRVAELVLERGPVKSGVTAK